MWTLRKADDATSSYTRGASYQTDTIFHFENEKRKDCSPVENVTTSTFNSKRFIGISVDKTLNAFSPEFNSHNGALNFGGRICSIDSMIDGKLVICATSDGWLHFVQSSDNDLQLILSVPLNKEDGPINRYAIALKSVMSSSELDLCDLWILLDDGNLICYRSFEIAELRETEELTKELLVAVESQAIRALLHHPWTGSFSRGILTPMIVNDTSYSMGLNFGETCAVFTWLGEDPDCVDYSIMNLSTTSLPFKKVIQLNEQLSLAADVKGNLHLIDFELMMVIDSWFGWKVEDVDVLEARYTEGANRNDLIALARSTKDGGRVVEIRSFPGLEEIFSVEVNAGPICLLPLNCDNGPLAFLDGDYGFRFDLKMVTEVDPNEKLARLLSKRRFDDAEALAEAFHLDTKIILVHKIGHFLSILHDEEVLIPLFDCLMNLETLVTYPQLIRACLNAVLPSAASQEKLLLIIIDKLQTFMEDSEIKTHIDRALQLLCRLKTFRALTPQEEFSEESWSRFINSDMYKEFFRALCSDNLPNAFLLWNNHKICIMKGFKKFGDQAVHDMLYVTSAKYQMKTSVLDWISVEFLPSAIQRLPPSCLMVVSKHFRAVVEELEIREAEGWPKNGINILSHLLDMKRLRARCGDSPTDEAQYLVQQIGCQSEHSPFWSLIQLLKQLKVLLSLRDKYNFRVTLGEFVQLNTMSIAYRMLDKELNLGNLPAAMDSRIRSYLKDEGMESSMFLSGYIDDLLSRNDSLESNKLEVRVAAVLPYLPNTSSRFRSVLRLAEVAKLPWSEHVWRLVRDALSSPASTLCQTAIEHPFLEKLKRLSRIAEVYSLLEKYEVYTSEKLDRFHVRFIIQRIVKSLLMKSGFITAEELADLIQIGAEVEFEAASIRRFCMEVFLRCRMTLKCLAFIDTFCSGLERHQLLSSAFYLSTNAHEDAVAACCVGERLVKELDSYAAAEVKTVMRELQTIRFLKAHFDITASQNEVRIADWADRTVAVVVCKVLRSELRRREEIERKPLPLTSSIVSTYHEEAEVPEDVKEENECFQPSSAIVRLAQQLSESSGSVRLRRLNTSWCEAIIKEWGGERGCNEVLKLLRKRDHGVEIPVILKLLMDGMRTMKGETQYRAISDLISVVEKEVNVAYDDQILRFLEGLKILQSLQSIFKERQLRQKALSSRLDPFLVWRFTVHYRETCSFVNSRLLQVLNLAWGFCDSVLMNAEDDKTEELAESLMEGGLHFLSYPLLRRLDTSPVLISAGKQKGQIIETMLASRYLDPRLVLRIVQSMPNSTATRSLMRAIARAPNSHKVVKIVSDVAFYFAETINHPRSLEMGRKWERIAHWLRRCPGMGSDWGPQLHNSRYSEALNILLNTTEVITAATIGDFCVDFNQERDSALKRFLNLKLSWRRPDEENEVLENEERSKMVKKQLQLAEEAFDLLYTSENVTMKQSLLEWLERLIEESDSFEHEKIQFLLRTALRLAGPEKQDKLKRGLEIVDFLLSWVRSGTASQAETEWLVQKTEQHDRLLYSESLILSPLARTRLPYHAMMEKPLEIIEPEINVNNVSRLLSLCHLFGMTSDSLHMVAINNLIRSHVAWIRQNPGMKHSGILWQGPSAEVDETIWSQFSKLIHQIDEPKLALQCAQAMVNATPSGKEKLRALELCMKFAQQWVKSVDPSMEQEMALAHRAMERFTTHWKNLGLEGILHQYGLASKQQLALIRQPDALLRHLIESQPSQDGLSAEKSSVLSAAVNVAEQCGLESAMVSKSLLCQWLHLSDAQHVADMDMTFTFGDMNPCRASSDDSDRWQTLDEDDELARAVSLLRHPDFCPQAIDVASKVAFGDEEWTSSRIRALYCLLHALPLAHVEKLAAEQYKAQMAESEDKTPPPTLVKYTAALIYTTRAEEFSQFSVQEMLTEDKGEMVLRLLRERRVLNSVKGLSMMCDILRGFNLTDPELWAFLLSRLRTSKFGSSSKPVFISALSHSLSALPPDSQLMLWIKVTPEGLADCLESVTEVGEDTSLELVHSLASSPLLLLLIQQRRLLANIIASWGTTARALLFRYVLRQNDLREVFRLENVEVQTDGLGFVEEEVKAMIDTYELDISDSHH